MQTIEPFRRFAFQMPVRAAVCAFSQNDVSAFLPFRYQLRDHFDRVLQVNVDRNNRVAGGMLKTSESAGSLPKLRVKTAA